MHLVIIDMNRRHPPAGRCHATKQALQNAPGSCLAITSLINMNQANTCGDHRNELQAPPPGSLPHDKQALHHAPGSRSPSRERDQILLEIYI